MTDTIHYPEPQFDDDQLLAWARHFRRELNDAIAAEQRCRAGQGDVDDWQAMLATAPVDTGLWLYDQANQYPPVDKRDGQVSFKVYPHEHALIKQLAKLTGRSEAATLRQAVWAEYVRGFGGAPPPPVFRGVDYLPNPGQPQTPAEN